MKRLLMAALLAACTISAFALPSVDAVRAEVAKGHDAQAEQMVREVLADHPDSARARYVHAEILAHGGRFAEAAEEAAQARRLDPGLSFAQPEAFKSFEALLAREQGGAASQHATQRAQPHAVAPASGAVPTWVWIGGLALLAWLVVSRAASSGRPTSMPTPAVWGPTAGAPSTGTTAMSYAGGVSPPTSGAGGALLSTGLAVAGGVAAGMLADRLLDSHREPVGGGGYWPSAPAAPVFEPIDNATDESAAARELEARPIDMGTGDGWGGGDASQTASDDGW